MKQFRVSIALIMGLIVALAINLAVLRQLGPLVDADSPLAVVIFSTLVMANLLTIGVYRLKVGGGPFVEGFVAFGTVAFLLHLAVVRMYPKTAENIYDVAFGPLGKMYDKHVSTLVEASAYRDNLEMLLFPVIMVAISLVISLPQLFVAFIGGWLFKRYRRQGMASTGEAS